MSRASTAECDTPLGRSIVATEWNASTRPASGAAKRRNFRGSWHGLPAHDLFTVSRAGSPCHDTATVIERHGAQYVFTLMRRLGRSCAIHLALVGILLLPGCVNQEKEVAKYRGVLDGTHPPPLPDFS